MHVSKELHTCIILIRAGTINQADNQVTLYNMDLSNEYTNELIFILSTSNTPEMTFLE